MFSFLDDLVKNNAKNLKDLQCVVLVPHIKIAFKGGSKELNIHNNLLKICSLNPLTGYTRDGYCRTNETDTGNHLVCAKMDKDYKIKK